MADQNHLGNRRFKGLLNQERTQLHRNLVGVFDQQEVVDDEHVIHVARRAVVHPYVTSKQ